MFDERLRTAQEKTFVRLAQRLRIDGWPPLRLTAAALLFGLLAAFCLWQQAYTAGFLFWFLNRLFDGMDGAVARARRVQSDWGGYVDILSDFLVYAAVPTGLAAGKAETAVLWALIFLLASFYVNAASWMYLSALLEKRYASRQKTSINMPPGLIGGLETSLFYAVFILFPNWLPLLFTLMSVLVLVTTGQRLRWAKRHLNGRSSP